MDSKKNQVSQEEINLYALWKILLKRKKLILGFLIVSFCVTTVASLWMSKIYRGEVVIRIILKEVVNIKELIELEKFDREVIKKILPDYQDSIVHVKMIQIPGSNDKLKILVDLRNPSTFLNFAEGLNDYLNHLPMVTMPLQEQREKLNKQVEEIEITIQKMQEDLKQEQNLLAKGKLNPLGVNLIDINRSIYSLKIEKFSMQQLLKKLNGFEILKGPIVSQEPVKPRPLVYAFVAAVASLIIGAAIAVFLSYIEKEKSN